MQPTALMNGDEIKIRLAVCKAVMNVSVMDAGFRRANEWGVTSARIWLLLLGVLKKSSDRLDSSCRSQKKLPGEWIYFCA